MDNKKAERYRLKSAWYAEGEPQEIVVDLGGGKLARALLNDEHKFSQVLRLARRVISKGGRESEREDLAHILAYILYVEARDTGNDPMTISLSHIMQDVMKNGSGVLAGGRYRFKSPFHSQVCEAFPGTTSASGRDPVWKVPLLRRFVPHFKQSSGNDLPWLDVDAWMKACERIAQHDKNRDYGALVGLLTKTIPGSGFYRPAQPLPDPEAIAGLAEEFPNFAEVAEFYAQQAAISKISGKGRVRLPPVLLLGPPGVGKTAFSMRLAERLGVSQFAAAFSGASQAGVLCGSSSFWATGRQGQVFDALLLGKQMNPVFLIDELDKAGDPGRYRSPIAPLHQLIEVESARVFQDEFVETPADVSWFTWLATANEAKDIPESILSRLVVFEVEPPTPAELRKIGAKQYRRTLEEFGLTGKLPDVPPAGVLDRAVASPREMSLALRRLIGRMAREYAAGREIRIEQLLDQVKGKPDPEKPRIGFV